MMDSFLKPLRYSYSHQNKMTRVRGAAVPFRSMGSINIAPFFSIDTKHTNAVTMYARKKHTFAFKKNFIPLSAHTLLLGNTSVVLMKSSEHERLSGRMIDTIRSKSSLAIMDEEEDVIYEHTKSHDITKKPFLLTDIGEGIHEVEVIKWHVKPGDIVKQFDQICEVQSDKASVDITSRYDGVIDELCGEIGGMIEVGSPLLFMRLEGEDGGHVKDGVADIMPPVSDLNAVYSSNPDAVIETEASRDMEPISNDEVGEKTFSSQNKKVLTTPAVRRLGMEYDIDLSRIIGTGKGGRILKSDILRELHEQGIMSHDGEEETPKSSAASNLPNKHTSIADEIIPIRGYNRIMVNAMESTLQVPHMVYTDEVEMSALKKCREDLKPLAESKGVKISYLPFMVKACSLAMLEYPLLNSSIDAENMTLTIHQRHDIGIAIDSPKGLVVPVLRDCQDMSVLDIAMELNRFRDLANTGGLTEDDLISPTFTLSNIGSIGGTVMSPIVLPPQVAIGAMGKIQRLPRFVGDSMDVEEAHLMNISWGGDHRVLDGGTLGKFSNAWKSYIEKPFLMLFNLK